MQSRLRVNGLEKRGFELMPEEEFDDEESEWDKE